MEKENYLLINTTPTICSVCLKKIDGKIIKIKDSIYIKKKCKEHGEQLEILEEDANYYLKRNAYDKPGTKRKTQTEYNLGCPYDCGLCDEHEQHTCIALIEVTNKCDLKCPVCYANSGEGKFLDLKTIEKMMDFYQDSENNLAEVLQISGGEPTTHPEILQILKMAKEKNFQYVMLNTNGLRIAKDEEFVRELSKLIGGFEIYLQFDGFDKKSSIGLRGKDLTLVKKKAIDNLVKYKIPITLVSTIKRGLNDLELGNIIEFGINTPCIRGINFQPVSFVGRTNSKDTKNRMTLTGIINGIEKQTKGMIKKDDFIPLPCDVDRVSIGYFYKSKKGFLPLMKEFDTKKYKEFIDNTFNFNAETVIKKVRKNLLCSCKAGKCMNFLSDIKNIIPEEFENVGNEKKAEYINNNTFRISIVSFIDPHNFDARSMKKECVHIITPDLKKIPFSAYNIIHRKC